MQSRMTAYTHVVVVGVAERLARVGLAEVLVERAAVADIRRARDRVGQLVEGRAAADIAGGNSGAAAQAGAGDLVVEDRAVAAVVAISKERGKDNTRALLTRC